MRTLFVKIFVWFWLAMTIVGIASLVSAVTTQSYPFFVVRWLKFLTQPPLEGQVTPNSDSRAARWLNLTGNVVKLSGQTALQAYESKGETALRGYIERVGSTAGIRIFLFEGQNRELSGQAGRQSVRDIMMRAAKSGVLEYKRTEDSLLLAHKLSDSGGNNYVVVGEMPSTSFSYGAPGVLVMNFIAILITAGGVCYWLASYITTPIRKLQAAARRLADGDLTIRIGKAVGNRHDEISDLSRDFDLMAERIETLLNTQRRLLQDISHELRSPLARLRIALELARRHSGQKAHPPLDRIGREAERLQELIAQLLTLTRLESGADEAHQEPVDMAALVREIAADADFEARSRRCTVRISTNGTCIVSGRRELLRSAVENVVRNAIFYTAEGSEVQITLDNIDENGHSGILIRVRDHGPGVPDAALADLFRPFYRVGNARDRKTGGSGLGLAIAERAVQSHGGSITAANAPNGGLIVTVQIPAASA